MAEFTPIATMVKGPNIDPAQVTGLINMGRVSQQFQKEQELLPYEIEKGKAESKKTQLGLQKDYFGVAMDEANAVLGDPRLKNLNPNDPKSIEKAADAIASATSRMIKAGVPPGMAHSMTAPYFTMLKNDPGNIVNELTNSLKARTGPVTTMEAVYPSAQMTNVGGAIVPTAGGRPGLSMNQPGAQVGEPIATTIAPQVVTNQITGAPMVIGGGRAPGSQPQMGGGSTPGASTMPTPPAAPAAPAMNAPSGSQGAPAAGGVTTKPMLSGGQLTQLPNESPANFNARVAQTQNAVAKAQDQFSNPNSEFGHIPTVKTINNNILTLLKDPNVNTGSVQSYIAGKIRQENLSAQEQELAKYLAQRVQNLTPKSDADADAKRKAYGSLELKKEALIDLIRQDNAWVTTQELQAKGVLNNGGDPTNPNFGRVAQFNNQFAKLAQNPKLMKYIAIVGENQGKVTLDADDIKALQKELGSMKPEARQALELQRQTLLKLVNGGQ